MWVVFAILQGWASTARSLLSENTRSDKFILGVYGAGIRGLAALCLAFIWHIHWPESPLFYAWVGLNAVLFAYSDIQMFGINQTYKSLLTTTTVLLRSPMLFIAWTALGPMVSAKAHYSSLWQNPFSTAGAFLLVVLISRHGKRLTESSGAFRTLLKDFWPILLCTVAGDIVNKVAMDAALPPAPTLSHLLEAGLAYVCIQSPLMALIAFAFAPNKRALFTPMAMKEGLPIGLAFLGVNVCKNAAVALAFNPAIVAVVSRLEPLWVLVYKGLKGEKIPQEKRLKTDDILILLGLVSALIYVSSFIKG